MTNVRSWVWKRRRRFATWALVVAIIALLALPYAHDTTDFPLDPDSAKPDGTKAFGELMRRAGSTYSVDDRPSSGTAVLLNDTLSQDEADAVYSWVKDGGRLIVADVRSSLVQSSVTDPEALQPTVLTPHCSVSYVSGVTSIRPNTKADYNLFAGDDTTETACFPYKKGYFLTEHIVGAGSIVDVGSADLFTNQDLANYDNAVLVTNLVQPGPGTHVVWLRTNDTAADNEQSSGGSSISDLLPGRVKESLAQLIIASAVLILWRGRRLGQPVDEHQLVEIPGSQLVVASGNLLETAGQSADAAAMMRYDVKRSFAQLLGVDPSISDEALVQILHDRTNIPTDRLEAVLFRMPAADNTQLITLAQQLEYLYMEVSRVR